MSGHDLAWYSRYTVFLGSDTNFDMWGNPDTGCTCYVGNPAIGCHTGSFGDRRYWRAHLAYRAGTDHGETFTPAGMAW